MSLWKDPRKCSGGILDDWILVQGRPLWPPDQFAPCVTDISLVLLSDMTSLMAMAGCYSYILLDASAVFMLISPAVPIGVSI